MAVGAAHGPVATSERFRSGIARYSDLRRPASGFRSLTSNF
jgi:hypothetical protein